MNNLKLKCCVKYCRSFELESVWFYDVRLSIESFLL